MRKVNVTGAPTWCKISKEYHVSDRGEAIFHQWGVAYEQFEAGPGNYNVAIVEWPDGTVEEIQSRFIRFIDKAEPTPRHNIKTSRYIDCNLGLQEELDWPDKDGWWWIISDGQISCSNVAELTAESARFGSFRHDKADTLRVGWKFLPSPIPILKEVK